VATYHTCSPTPHPPPHHYAPTAYHYRATPPAPTAHLPPPHLSTATTTTTSYHHYCTLSPAAATALFTPHLLLYRRSGCFPTPVLDDAVGHAPLGSVTAMGHACTYHHLLPAHTTPHRICAPLHRLSPLHTIPPTPTSHYYLLRLRLPLRLWFFTTTCHTSPFTLLAEYGSRCGSHHMDGSVFVSTVWWMGFTCTVWAGDDHATTCIRAHHTYNCGFAAPFVCTCVRLRGGSYCTLPAWFFFPVSFFLSFLPSSPFLL